jgi:hypothetical protein
MPRGFLIGHSMFDGAPFVLLAQARLLKNTQLREPLSQHPLIVD